MSNEPQPDGTYELIDALREEMLAEGPSADLDEARVPDGIVQLLASADVPVDVALALDDLLAEDDTISGALHARVLATVRDEIDRRASRPIFLEQCLRAERERQSIDVATLAARVNTTADTIEAIELAERPLRTLAEDEIAAWVDGLDLELDVAMEALQASLLRPASAYRGDDEHLNRRDVDAFVATVRRLITERRQQRGSS
jgi:hypothetical protein